MLNEPPNATSSFLASISIAETLAPPLALFTEKKFT